MLRSTIRSRAFRRYLLLEIPGWILAVIALGGLVWLDLITRNVAIILFALWIVKDLALFPVLRIAYEDSNPDATHSLIGAVGTARERLEPEGYVRIGAELWRARLLPDAAPVEAGAAVRVLGVDALTLRVEAA